MTRKLIFFAFVIVSGFLLSGCSLKSTPSAIQVTANPVANVFIDGKMVGKTPYQANDLKAGEVTVKLIPESTTTPLVSWEGKVKLNSGVLTLVDREFSASDAVSSGQILTLEKIKDDKSASVSVVSDPDGSLVNLDGETKGFAPIALDKVSIGDHQITVSKEGYAEKVVKAKTIAGYKLIINVKLAQIVTAVPSVTITPVPTGSIRPTVTAKPTVTPKPTTSTGQITPSPATGSPVSGNVEIKETPTGWLRVRSGPSTSSTEIAKVNPGEKYKLLEETTGWYKITLSDGKEGWISSQYASKVN